MIGERMSSRGTTDDGGQRSQQPAADVAGDLVGAAGEDGRRVRRATVGERRARWCTAELQLRGDVDTVDGGQAVVGVHDDGRRRVRVVGDGVGLGALDDGHVAGVEQRRLPVVGNDPGMPAQRGGQGERRLVGDAQRPRRLEDGLAERGGAGPYAVEQIAQRVHAAQRRRSDMQTSQADMDRLADRHFTGRRSTVPSPRRSPDMYAITGVTGHVGGATARALLAAGAPVRAVVRDAEKGSAWAERGRRGRRRRLHRPDGAGRRVRRLPRRVRHAADHPDRRPTPTTGAWPTRSRPRSRTAASPHVVMLSSIGADLADGTGPIRWLHHLEHRLRETGARLTAIRSPHFQEKVEAVLGRRDRRRCLPRLRRLRRRADADGRDPRHRRRGGRGAALAAAGQRGRRPGGAELHRAAGRRAAGRAARNGSCEVVTIPRAGWLDALTGAGVPPLLAAELVASTTPTTAASSSRAATAGTAAPPS